MTISPFHRCLAAILVAQPIFWAGNVAYAQSPEGAGAFDGLGNPDPGAQGQRGVGANPAPPGGPAPTYPGAVFPGSNAPGFPTPGVTGQADAESFRADRSAAITGTQNVPAIDEPVDPDRYTCGPGDVLELNFWGVQNFKLRVNIDVEGRAFVPKVGYFALQGKTLTQARRVLRESVARFYPRLSFDVTLADPRTFLVQVVDAVARPGSFPARATERVASVIAKAGGFGAGGSRRRVEVRRRGGAVVTADLLLFAQTGDVKHNPYLLEGDVVRVPFEELTATIAGAVNRPGRYELVNTRDLAELVALAGGLSPAATQLLPVTIVRRDQNDREDLKVYAFAGGKLPAKELQADDAVRIPALRDLQQSIVVVGAIAGATALEASVGRTSEAGVTSARSTAPEETTATRRVPFVKGDTVRTLLERVGGVGPLADLTGSYLLRAGQSIAVDLDALVLLRDFGADRAVELGDTLVIPFKRRNILVEGAVFAPGSYPYNPAFHIEQYLSLAGGRSRNAQPVESVRVITPSGDTKEFRADLKIDPGSSLVVPERNFSRSEVVQMVLGAAGIILSGVAVVIAARK
jgi:protein involved in polysaccharide export with SLBB domain